MTRGFNPPGRDRRWAGGDLPWQHHPRGGSWAGWGGWEPQRGRPGPPPWLAGLFGLAQGGSSSRGARVRRGDVRSAILDVLSAEPLNGYQVIQQIADRTGGAWRPSPGSVYPTIAQLEDEGLVEGAEPGGRRAYRLTPIGEEYVAANGEELAAVWAAFEAGEPEE
ncbi:MAG: PadR family transcriptional regulator, partial [Nocardioides sp.]